MRDWKDIKVYTLADIFNAPKRSHEEEAEYRRGYRDGYIAAAKEVYDLWFLGKNKSQDKLFDHWQGELSEWECFEHPSYFPPSCVVRCVYCGKIAEHLDHVIPKSRGGSSDDENLVPSCAHCNTSKCARTPEEWRDKDNRYDYLGKKKV